MSDFDLVIRNGTVATAADTTLCDVGISGGAVAALGRNLGTGTREIDAAGLVVAGAGGRPVRGLRILQAAQVGGHLLAQVRDVAGQVGLGVPEVVSAAFLSLPQLRLQRADGVAQRVHNVLK